MKKKPLIVFTFLLTTLTAIAQGMDPVEGRGLVSVETIIGKAVVADKSYSSIPISGTIGGASFSLNYRKGKVLNEIRVVYMSGVLHVEDQSTVSARQTYLNIYCTKLFRISSQATSSFICRIGGSIDFLHDRRKYDDFVNRNKASESMASLSGAFAISYYFKDAGMTIAEQMAIPLVAYIMQPGSGSEGNASADNRLSGLSSFFGVRNILVLEKFLNVRHSLALSYGWNYYQIRGFREVKQASHQIGLTYTFIF